MSINISARIRPLLDYEEQRGEKAVWKANPAQKTLYYEEPIDEKKKRRDTVREFTFSDVFEASVGNQEIYNKMVKDLVATAVVGLSASFFVYGQTGSGKTHTISGTKYEEGVFQLAIKDILERQKSSSFKVSISAFEVYKEQIFDLLGSEMSCRDPLKIKEKKNEGKFEVEGLGSHLIKTWDDFKQTIYKAESRRHFASTYLKHHSSRSHFGVQVTVVLSCSRKGQLNFFDLAGCEKLMAYKDSCDMKMGDESSPLRVSQ